MVNCARAGASPCSSSASISAAQDRKRRPSGTSPVGLPGPNSFPNRFVVRDPHTGIPQPVDPSQPILGGVLAVARTGSMSKLSHGRVHTCRRPVRQPQAGRPRPDPRKDLRDRFVCQPGVTVARCVIQETQRQRTVDINPHLPKVPEFPFDSRIGVLSSRAGQDPIQLREASEITAKGRAILRVSLLHCPTSQSIVDSLDSRGLARTPAQDVPEERVGRLGRVLGSQRAFDLHPVVLVQVLLGPRRANP